MRKNTLLYTGLFILLMLLTGCEYGHDKSVTGDFFNRKPGELKNITAYFDSITSYQDKIGEAAYTFAGSYSSVSAFTVIKFPQPAAEFIDSLESAAVKLDVGDTWRDGQAGFELFETTSDWSDSVRLEPDSFLRELDAPVSAFSDTASSIGSLDFPLGGETINNMRSWDGSGSFLVKNAEACRTMVGISSRYSTYIPRIEYIIRNAEGLLDTTSTDCIETNYYFDTGFDSTNDFSGFTAVISDADARACVLKMIIPAALDSTAAINRCVVKLNILDSIIPAEEVFKIGFYRLTAPVTNFLDAQYESTGEKEPTVDANSSSIEFDITSFVSSWHQTGESNFGILIKPLWTSSAPNQVVLTPEDSLTITYTSRPEVE